MYLRVVNYDTMAACVQGYDLAKDLCFLDSFGDWLRQRVDPRFHNMTWSVLVLCIAFPGSKVPWENLDTSEANSSAIQVLFACLSEYCEATNKKE